MKRAKIRKINYTYKGKTEELWLVSWRDLKRKRREKRFPNKRHAEAYASKIDRELADNIHVADRGTITFGKACEEYLKAFERLTIGPSRRRAGATLEGYKVMARNNAVPWFGNTKLNKITSRDVQAYVDDVGTRYQASSCRRAFAVVWNVLKYAVEQDWIPRNPLKDKRVELPPIKKKSADDIPSFEAIRDLMVYLHGKRHPKQYKLVWDQRLPMIALAGFAGLRAGECCALEWNNVDLIKREVKIDKSFSRIDGIKGPKSVSSNRTVPMNPILHNIMVRYAGLVGRTGPVFRNCGGSATRRNYDSFGTQLTKSLQEAKIGHFNFHALRHFAGSAWLAQGMRIQDVQWLLGHSDIKMTMSTYAHQLKGDDHARRVLNEQVTRFPGIPHSLIHIPAETPQLAPPPELMLPSSSEVSADGNVAADPQPFYQPSPQAYLAPHEAVPVIEIPPEAPQWVGYAVRLLQSNMQVRDVSNEVGYDKSRMWKVFKNFGLPGPERVRLDALWARARYMKDNGCSDKEIARVNHVKVSSVSRMIGKRRPGSRQDRLDEKRPPRILKCKTCGKEYAWDKAGHNPENCLDCRAEILAGNNGQYPKSTNPPKLRVRHLKCETCGEKFDWDRAGKNPRWCLKCKKSKNEKPVNTLLTQVNLPSEPVQIRENGGETQLNLWKN